MSFANFASATVTPTSINAFIDTCAEGGQQAKCCLIPILGQALLCSDVNPTAEALLIGEATNAAQNSKRDDPYDWTIDFFNNSPGVSDERLEDP
jgi:hypothetical protein